MSLFLTLVALVDDDDDDGDDDDEDDDDGMIKVITSATKPTQWKKYTILACD